MLYDLAIILCTYNGQKYLDKQLQSYIDQYYKQWSLFIFDDHSIDKTTEIIKKFINNNQEHLIKLVVNKQNFGFVRNFLDGIKKTPSDFKYYALSDQDDIWCKDKLLKAVSYLEKIPNYIPALYCSSTELIDSLGNKIGFSPLPYKGPSFSNALVQNIAAGNTMVFNNAAYKAISRILTDKINIISHDWFVYQLISGVGGKIFYDKTPTVLYRQYHNNVIGLRTGFFSNVLRLINLFNNSYKQWHNKHVIALKKYSVFLTEENKKTLNTFEQFRNKWILLRLIGFFKSGIHKQNFCGQIFLWLGVIFNKI